MNYRCSAEHALRHVNKKQAGIGTESFSSGHPLLDGDKVIRQPAGLIAGDDVLESDTVDMDCIISRAITNLAFELQDHKMPAIW